MMHTIRVDRVLRETVNTPYADLVTRATGAAVRTSIRQTIAGLAGGTTLLDFSDVGLVDWSCADEVVAKLLLETTDEISVVLGGLREEQSEAIGHVLAGHELAVVSHETPGGVPRLLGRVGRDAQEAFDYIQQKGTIAAEALALALGWDSPTARGALEALARLRLIRRSGTTFTPLPLP